MDEYSDGGQNRERTGVLSEKAAQQSSAPVARVSAPAQKNTPLPPLPPDLPRVLMRHNRMIMRKKRIHARYSGDLAVRVVIGAAIFIVLLFTVLSSGAGGAYAYYRSQLPLLNGIANHSLFQSTHIYDRNGKLLYVLYNHQTGYGRRTYVDYTQIPAVLVNATVAAEDHTFWQNNGVDIQGTIRAALADIQSQTVVEGGSTVTQQLVKNQFFLNQPRTLGAKAQEALLSYGLTQQYPKWKIIEMYLNTVYYGDLNYGIEAAAQDYFNLQSKCSTRACTPSVSKLDLAQASLLAGLPQSPSNYNPVFNKSTALARQKIVLQSMLQLGMATRRQVAQAEKEMATYTFRSHANDLGVQAPHFVQYVVDEQLIPLFGAQNLENGGYNIYTTLDLNLEKKVEQIAYNHLYKPQYDSYLGTYGTLSLQHNVNNAAVVVMNPFNGEILAMDGSANYNDNSPQVSGQFNVATSLRQPGSAFKPIVYASAFEMGWYPAMIVPDHKTVYPSQPSGNPPSYYSPPNYDGTYHSGYPMTIRTAIANSFNIPAVDTAEYVGIPNILNMAGRLGLSEVASRKAGSLGPSIALGSTEVSLLHLTSAYATFADRGVRVPPTSVLEITDNTGQSLYTYNAAHPQGVRVMGQDVAFLMSSILSDKAARYHEFGPGNPLELTFPASAKTGTTDSFRDNWTMGYTPYLTVGVWAGNSNNAIMNNVIGITGAGPIWHDVMEYATNLYHFPADDFIRPSDVHAGSVSALTGLLPHPGEATVTDWFIDGTMPTIQGSYVNPGRPCFRGGCRRRPGPIFN